MANVKVTERADGSIYLQCRCGEMGQPCPYQGEITFAPAGLSLLRQARIEAFEHCWSEHRVPAWNVSFDLSQSQSPGHISADLRPFLVTTEPQKAEQPDARKKAASG